jgi:hypothetical protein
MLTKNDLERRLTGDTSDEYEDGGGDSYCIYCKEKYSEMKRKKGWIDAGVVRNGHTKTALVGLRRHWIILCVALVKRLIKHTATQLCVPDCTP